MVRVPVLEFVLGLSVALSGCDYPRPPDVPDVPDAPDAPACPDVPDSTMKQITGGIHPALEFGTDVAGATVDVIQIPRIAGCPPLATTTSAADGRFSVMVPASVETYLEVTSAGHLPTHLYSLDIGDQYVLVIGGAALEADAAMAGASQRKDAGFIFASVFESNQQAIGATVSAAGQGQVCYQTDQGPRCSATATGAEGLAWIFNVQAGEVDVSGSLADGSPLRGRRVSVEASAIVQVQLEPQ